MTDSDEPDAAPKQMRLGGAVFLGVGAMVGAGIFALLGQAGAVAGSAVWISFLIAASVAALLAYTISKLERALPVAGRPGLLPRPWFGDTHVTGIASWLFYLAGMIVTAMVALSFGGYARELFLPDNASAKWSKVFAIVVVVAMALVNRIGADAVGKLQSLIVVVLLAVFAVFIVATLKDADFSMLAVSTYPSWNKIISGRGTHLLRLSWLCGHRQHCRVDAESRPERASCHLPGAAHHRRPLCVDVHRCVRFADRGLCCLRLRRDRTRRSRTAITRGRRFHDDVDRCPARHVVVGQRQLVRCAEPHRQPR